MTKKVFTIFLLLAILTGTVWIFVQFEKINEQAPDAIKFVPNNVTTIINLNTTNWNTFYAQGSALNQLLDQEYHQLQRILHKIDSLRSQQEGIQELLDLGEKYLFFYEKETKGKNWVYTMGLLSSHDNSFIKNTFPKGNYKENLLNGKSWFKGKELSWGIINQVLFVSPNENLLEFCLSADEFIYQDSTFIQAFTSQGADNIQLFSRKSSGDYNLIKPQKNKTWVSYETRVIDQKLEFFGYSFQEETTQNRNSSTIEIPINIIPKKELKLESIQISNISKELERIKEKIIQEDRINVYVNNLTAIESNCNCEAKKLAFNRTKTFGEFSNGKHNFVYINYPNFDESIEEYSPLINEELIGEKDGYPIFELKYQNLYSTLLDQSNLQSNLFSIKYFSFKDDYLIFSSKIEDIHWLIKQWKDNNTLINDAEFASYAQQIQSSTNWLAYEANSKKKDFIFPFIIKNNSLVWQKDFETKGTYNHLTIPTSITTPKLANNTTSTQINTTGITNNSEANSSQEITYKLQGNSVIAPTIITNHYTKEKEIFIQDNKDNIYLINNKGEELWSKNITGKILSPVKQIDVYRNGKLQLVFNTENKIYCLDRNGKNVDGFPVTLKSKATSPLAIFDYDKKRKYRLVIGCEDKEIYNYTVEGKQTVGWNYKPKNSAVVALQHIRIKGKDYIFSLLANNKISILKRTGVTKFKSEASATKYNHQGYALDYASKIEKTRMLYVSTDGNLLGVSFDNEKNEVLKSGFNSDTKFTYKDIDGDKKSDIILSDNQTLTVLSSDLKEIFLTNLGSKILFAPSVYKINAQDIQIGINTKNGQFHLFNSQGKIITGYPIQSNQAIKIIDLDKDGNKERVLINQKLIVIE